MKPEKHELDLTNYPFAVELSTRYGDTDTLRHINNVAIAQFFEEGRVKFGMFSRGKTFEKMPELGKVVTVSVLITYLGEVFYPEPVTLGVGVDHIGNSSHTLVSLMVQNGKPVAHSRTTLVQFCDSGSTPIPDSIREILEKFRLKPAAAPT